MTAQKLPAMQFYPGDWRKDVGIQSLDYFERGVWWEVLCLMHESEERGRLVLNGRPMPDPAIARVLDIDSDRWLEVRTKLLDYGVASEDDEGVLYNRRMVRDERVRQARVRAGRKGGKSGGRPKNSEKSKTPANAKQTQKQTGSTPETEFAAPACGDPSDQPTSEQSKSEANAKQNKPPSVSSSVSTSSSEERRAADAAPRKKPAASGDLDQLCGLLDSAGAVAARGIADTVRNGDAWAKSMLASWVGFDGGEPGEPVAAKVDRSVRLQALSLGLGRYRSEQEPWRSNYFRGFMRKAVEEVKPVNGHSNQEGHHAEE